MPNWVPLHNHSTFSLLDGVSKPKQIAERCLELGYNACGISDHGSISGAIQFLTKMKEKGIKPILCSEIYLSEQDPTIKTPETRKLTHLPIFAKNLRGWKNLIKITSFSHHKDHHYYHPRINLEKLGEMAGGDLVCFSGHPGSDLSNAMFINPQQAYSKTNYKEVRTIGKYIHEDWEERIKKEAYRYMD